MDHILAHYKNRRKLETKFIKDEMQLKNHC